LARASAPAFLYPSRAAVGDRLANLPLDLLQRGKYQPRMDMRPETLAICRLIKSQGCSAYSRAALPHPNRGSRSATRYCPASVAERPAQMAGISKYRPSSAMSRRGGGAMALIENIQREDLNPWKRARALVR